MLLRRVALACFAVVSVALALGTHSAAVADTSDEPFAAEATSATEASARIDASVTRLVGGVRIKLPAAVVPSLAAGDIVDVAFPDYMRPPARVNYHVNVAFITEVAPQHWLFEQSSAADRLYTPAGRRRGPSSTAPITGIHFTYGSNDRRGIPIFTIVPEDAKTRGMDGVRDYVDAHPTNFKDMAQSSNDALDRYVWFADFVASIAQGSIDPISGRLRVESVAGALGANPTAIDACYAAGGSKSTVADCIKTTLGAVNYQANLAAPTQAQFFGAAVGAVAPAAIATYLVPLLSVWKLFQNTGHQQYEYLPTTLRLASRTANNTRPVELLTGLKVPTLRPPAAFSDVLFFTIGDPPAAANPPVVVDAQESNGVCASGARFALPLHLDRTSTYVHDTRVMIAPDGKPSYTVALDPRAAGTPTLPADQLTGAPDNAYTLRLTGRYGFDAIREPDAAVARVVVPRPTTWAVTPLAHRQPIAGGVLDAIATAPAAPCLTRAELQIGSDAPVALEIKRLSDRRVSLHGSLQNVPPGAARIAFYQADDVRDNEVETDVAITIDSPPAHVDPHTVPTALLGDAFILLQGTAFETIAGLNFGGTTYEKDGRSTADLACFTGPPIASAGLVAGETLPVSLIATDGSPGQAFVIRVAAPRPVLLAPVISPGAATHLSTDELSVTLTTVHADIPRQFEIRLRPALPPITPCDTIRSDTAPFAVLPAAASTPVSATSVRVVFAADRILGDRAFGAVQLQLADTATKSATAWLTLAGTFIRAPRIDALTCPNDVSAPCTLYGTTLDAIAGIDGPAGTLVTPGHDCVPNKDFACLTVPRLPRYVLHLVDAAISVTLPGAIDNRSAPRATDPPAHL